MTISPINVHEKDTTKQNDKVNDLVRVINGLSAVSATNVGTVIADAPNKATIHDNDEFAGADSEASGALKTWLWSVIKSTLKTYFDTLYAAAGSYLTASSSATLTNKTFNANDTGNALSNVETADFAANVVDTDGTLAANSDTRLASQKAVKTYVDASVAVGSVTQLATWTYSSAVASVPFTGLAQTYRALYVVWSGVSFASVGNELRLRVSVDNGSNYLSGATDYYNGATAATGIVMGGAAQIADTVAGYLVVHLYKETVPKYGQWRLSSSDTGDNQEGALSISTTSAINAIQFTGDGGNNFDAGTITVYGIP